jgi:hypothetical protein
MATDIVDDAKYCLPTITDFHWHAVPVMGSVVVAQRNPKVHIDQAVSTNSEAAVLSAIRTERRWQLARLRHVGGKLALELSDLIDGRNPFEIRSGRDITRALLENAAPHGLREDHPEFCSYSGTEFPKGPLRMQSRTTIEHPELTVVRLAAWSSTRWTERAQGPRHTRTAVNYLTLASQNKVGPVLQVLSVSGFSPAHRHDVKEDNRVSLESTSALERRLDLLGDASKHGTLGLW